MERVAILVSKLGEFKLFLPIIRELIQSDKLTPVIITSKVMNGGFKKYQNYDESFNPFKEEVEIHYIDHINEIPEAMVKFNLKVLMTVNVLAYSSGKDGKDGQDAALLKELKEKGIKVIYLQYLFDMISTHAKLHSFECLNLIDAFFCYSEYWREGIIDAFQKEFDLKEDQVSALREKFHIVGMPELDQVKTFNREEILKNYGLQANKDKIIFFDPVGCVNSVPNFFYKYYFTLHGSFREKMKKICKNLLRDTLSAHKFIRSLPNYFVKLQNARKKVPKYETLFVQLKQICLDNNYLLICKSRPKNNDPDFVRKGCDLYTFDQGYYPFTLLELLSVSDVYIGFNSAAVMEAVYCNLPALLFQVFPTEYQFDEYGGKVYQYIERCFNGPDEWLNFPGVTSVNYWNQEISSLTDAINGLKIDSRRREDYVAKFLGFEDNESCRRIRNILEERYC